MDFLKNLSVKIDKLSERLGYYTSWLTFILVLIICYDVFTRYVLNISSVGLQEMEWHIFALIFLMGGAYTLKIDDHVRVDVFYTNFSEKKKAWVNFLGSVLFLIPFCVLLIITSYGFVKTSFIMGETSPDAGGLPARYILKAFIPISFFFILLQGISLALKSWFKIFTKDLPQAEKNS
jgi:TRAP-type mannitol/chloroaromatic compound transport system permease small subunit